MTVRAARIPGKGSGQYVTFSRLVPDGDPVEVWAREYPRSFPAVNHNLSDSHQMQAYEFALDIWRTAGPFEAGRYVLVVVNLWTETEMFRLEWDFPLDEGWRGLPKPDRSFGFTVLARYPGSTPDVVAAHLDDFSAHYHGDIDTAELAVRTGYVLPEGVARPSCPGAHHTEP